MNTAVDNNVSNNTVPSITKNATYQKLVVNIKDLSQKAIGIKLVIGTYGGSKKDKKVSKEIANDKNADEKRTSLQKKLMKSKELNNVNSIATELRLWFRRKTLPWTNDGEGIVPMKNFLKVKMELENKVREFDAAVEKLVAAYDIIKENDKKPRELGGLGDLYNESDYPSKDSFRSKFYIKITPVLIQKDDFRCNSLSDAEIDNINKAIKEEGIKAAKAAQIDLLSRVREKLDHLRSRLADKDGRFHESNFTNLFETLEDADGLNITDDPIITQVITEVAKGLSVYSDADAIRTSSTKRKEALSETNEAIDKVNAAMKNFF